MQYVRSQVLCASLGALVLVACDKTPPRENVVPVSLNQAPPMTIVDAGSYVPQVDAGSGDSGADAAVVSMCPAPTLPSGEFSKSALLQSVAACTALQYCELEQLAQRFVDATQSYEADRSEANRGAARDAWFFLNQQMQVAELFQFGPAASGMEPGGQGLRSQMYAWPIANRCKVEEQLVDKTYEQASFATSDVAARGMGAAEYLLFEPGTSNVCSSVRPLNSQGSWAAMVGDELTRRKAAYAHVIAQDILQRVQTLRSAWNPSGGTFTQQFTQPGSGSVYANEQAALNAVGSALWYVDKELKDWKIARPAGFDPDCTSNCTSLRESLYAGVGQQNAAANLQGFRLLFEGCAPDAFGFDDWLRATNNAQLASDALEALRGAESAVQALQPSLEASLSDTPRMMATHAAIKRLTDLLKTSIKTALNLEPPMSSATDND